MIELPPAGEGLQLTLDTPPALDPASWPQLNLDTGLAFDLDAAPIFDLDATPIFDLDAGPADLNGKRPQEGLQAPGQGNPQPKRKPA
ncbi:MAG: hypothetical protein IKX21_06865 [Deltaproteobacteria bacterium]|nr:hypothetical protein [Deltaproteobacteria bacterium]